MARLFGIWFVLTALWVSPAMARDANPTITVRTSEDEDPQAQMLRIEALDINVDVVGGIAQTRMEVTIYNGGDDDAEGEFRLKMPKGAIVNGYALDIDGHLVDGVLVGKERAEKVYTERVTANIDPGIAEVVDENIYKTRIFPIFEDDRRFFALEFAVPLGQTGYELPLESLGKIDKISISVTGQSGLDVTDVILPKGKWDTVDNPDDTHKVTASNITIEGALRIKTAEIPLSITRHKSGQKFISFALNENDIKTLGTKAAPKVETVRIIWDTSLSRSGGDHKAERLLVEDYIKAMQPKTILFTSGAEKEHNTTKFTGEFDHSKLSTLIENLDYDGASNLSAMLSANNETRFDVCLVVTDGYTTLGPTNMPDMKCRVFVISKDKIVNRGMLTLLAQKGGGAFIRPEQDKMQGLKALSGPMTAQLKIDDFDVRRIDANGVSLIIMPYQGRLPNTLYTRFRLPDSTQKLLLKKPRKVTIIDHDGPATLWAQRRAEELRAGGDPHYDDLISHSQKYTLPGPETSLLVLEDISDYVNADIPPPANFPKEKMDDYKELLAERRKEKAETKAGRLDAVIDIWENQKDWWDTDFTATNKPEDKKAENGGNNDTDNTVEPTMTPPPAPRIENIESNEAGDVRDVASPQGFVTQEEEAVYDDIVVTGSRRKMAPSNNNLSVEIREWTPDRPYLKALKNAPENEYETVYRAQREIYGDLPAFYLEIADDLHRNGDTNLAAVRVLSALDLPSSNSATIRAVASRLMIYGEFDLAIELFEKVKIAAPDRPQPYYDLALAYIKYAEKTPHNKTANSYYLSALEQLDYIVRTPWPEDYDGIELIALTEANAVIARLPKNMRSKTPLDERLIDNLDVDMRVVIDWNVDKVDIDLWVDEPSTERAKYDNALTSSGGQVSNDMTRGYGPEQYLIRRSSKGSYTVQAHYFASDLYNPNGAVAVRARLFRDFGRENQTEQSVIIEFTENKRNDYLLGEIIVE